MSKSKPLNQWLWKWHIIAGLVSVPIMVLLCVTGAIYLFKPQFNDFAYKEARFVETPASTSRYSFSQQLATAEAHSNNPIMSLTLPQSDKQATEFREKGKGHAKNVIYVDPYQNRVTGTYHQKESFMYTIRKLHGELLLDTPGTIVVELIASWFIVLAITGIYVWWPYKGFSIRGFFTVRTDKTKRILWRDLHSVLGFWMSAFMLIIIAGGMPWTDVFGSNLKWVQKETNTGYAQHWRNAKGLSSKMKTTADSSPTPLSLDQVVNISNAHRLEGKITILLPMSTDGVYTIKNRSLLLRDQKVIHLDQYTGDTIKSLDWSSVGILMVLRQVFMRIHQGEYGLINLIPVLIITLVFMFSTIASLVSYLIRKPKGRWGLPKVPDGFHVGLPVLCAILFLALLFPVFGASLLVIFAYETIRKAYLKRQSSKQLIESKA